MVAVDMITMDLQSVISVMEQEKMYKQCVLRKENTEQTSWIPERFAKVGNILRLIEDDGWLVVHVGTELSDEQVHEQKKRIHQGVFPSIVKMKE